jgi:hypothetical protein
MQNQPTKRSLSLIVILALVSAIVVPIIVFAALVFDRYQFEARLHHELQARHKALGIAHDIDKEFARLFAIGQTLSISSSISVGDFPAFRQQALLVRDLAGVEVMLSRPGRQPLVDTRLPPAALQAEEEVDFGEEFSRQKQTIVVRVPSQGRQAKSSVAVVTPVFGLGTREVAFTLALFVPTERLQQFVDQTETPDWTASILDRQGVKLTSTTGGKDIVNRPGQISDSEKSVHEWSVWTGAGVDGQPVFVGYARSKLTGWLVAVDIQAINLQRALHRARRDFGISGSIALLASMLLGAWAMRRIWKQAIICGEYLSDRGVK